MLMKEGDSLINQLELVDAVQRLGLSYHFEDEIKNIMDRIYKVYVVPDKFSEEDLHSTALAFRLLRQHGYQVSQDVFNNFKDEAGNFKPCLCNDTQALLNLFEASYLSMEDENILDEASNFSCQSLKEVLHQQNVDLVTCALIHHSLDIPLHWRAPNFEARWYIELYERSLNANPLLLELAKLDFNIVQSIHQEDLKHSALWWRRMGWGEKLKFSRDRFVENFVWVVGINSGPGSEFPKRALTNLIALLVTVDDMYDVYGTLDELELFTDAIKRWDVNAVENFPDYMKICFLGFYNTINDIAYVILEKKGFHVLPHLRKFWADMCHCFLVEAKWNHSKHIPTLEEYMNNAWISVSAHVLLMHLYFLTEYNLKDEDLPHLESYPDIIRYSATVMRLANDLATSQDELKRGEISNSVQCYMHHSGVSEQEARDHIKSLINNAWKKMNRERASNSTFSSTYMESVLNLARVAQFVYRKGDGYTIQDSDTKAHTSSLLFDPVIL